MSSFLQRLFVGKLNIAIKRGMCSKVSIQPSVKKTDSISTADDVTDDFTTMLQEFDNRSVLDPPLSKDLYTSVTPTLKPTFNLAAYVNDSETLQQLLKLGVDLSAIERRKGLAQFVAKLDFEKDMKNHIRFLHDICALPTESLGDFLTKNPLIFKEHLMDLQTRVNYLQSKLFKPVDIARIVEVNPFWLMFSTQRIDKRLGYFQKKFQFSGLQIRKLAVKQPRLITYNLFSVERNTFSIKEEYGFSLDEVKSLILQTPRVLMMSSESLASRLDYVHNVMKISHEQIVQSSEILQFREHKIKQRHEYLKLLGRAQYDPTKDLYVSLSKLVHGTDSEFAMDVANTSLREFEMFLRQM
ncbi:Transcription termination factor 3, mitochondrial [Pseudolycoriella hygida]|uniref:Transcription termination factor 3, mitochondrial n=1 Tax=Pseudolycoriella hygida TaxID=35572 RepID=A0A9Q0MJT3_9DIPT|nr:Transcription termination factor 3, mitochondrial [Pseudolycoriella hygida]